MTTPADLLVDDPALDALALDISDMAHAAEGAAYYLTHHAPAPEGATQDRIAMHHGAVSTVALVARRLHAHCADLYDRLNRTGAYATGAAPAGTDR